VIVGLKACRIAVAAALCIPALAVSVSCSGHPPELAAVEYRLSLRPLDDRGNRVSEQLSVFAAARDEDGFKDLAALHVLHDGAEYLWSVGPEAWVKREQGKETWIGVTGLSAPDGGPLPRGLYRIVLEDLGGDSDETAFSLGAGQGKVSAFPEVRFRDGSAVVSSKYARTELLFLDDTGKVLRVVDAPRERVSMDKLYGSDRWKSECASLLAYAFDSERNIGIYSWTLRIRP
jgi:hypothetical protein